MAKILLNSVWNGFKYIWKELEALKSEEQEIILESTRLSGNNLAILLNERFKQRSQKFSSQILNDNDLLPFSFFQEGQDAGKGVCCLTRRISELGELDKLIEAAKKEPKLQAILLEWYLVDPVREPEKFKDKAPTVDLPYASGFLVGGDYLLTNRHVVEDQKLLKEFKAVFNYEDRARTKESHPELLARLDKYEFERFWVSSAPGSDLDYVLLKLKPLNGKSAGASFTSSKGVNLAKTLAGTITPGLSRQNLMNDTELRANLDKAFVDFVESNNFVSADPIHMIEHPGGRPKEIVVFNNRLENVYENFLEYETDAEPGSSGSPLFITAWQVVGIHQASLLDENSTERKVKGYLGIRMDSILTDLRGQIPSNSDLRDFFDIVDGTATPTQPQVFILAGRRRSFLGNDADLERQAMENLSRAIRTELARRDSGIRIVPISGQPEQPYADALKQAIESINRQRNPDQRSELAIEILTNRSGSPSKVHGITLYYSAANPFAQQLVQFLQAALKTSSPLPYIGAFPDSYTNNRRLAFCREINLPAVVIYVGYLDNESDRTYIEAVQRDSTVAASLATSLTAGILNALQAFDPQQH